MQEFVLNIFKGLLTGILCAYLLIFGLRPSIPYPNIIIELFENKFIIVLLLILNYYIIIWDFKLGILTFLCILAIIFDYMVFILPFNSVEKYKTGSKIDNMPNRYNAFIENFVFKKVEKSNG